MPDLIRKQLCLASQMLTSFAKPLLPRFHGISVSVLVSSTADHGSVPGQGGVCQCNFHGFVCVNSFDTEKKEVHSNKLTVLV